MTTTQYVCFGDIRGYCGHRHRSIKAALRCVRDDQSDCETVGGYSDRRIMAEENGERRPLADDEWDEMNYHTGVQQKG